MKNRKEINKILDKDISERQKIEEISKLKTDLSDVSRLIIMTTEEVDRLTEGQKISGLGNSWKDVNDANASNISYQAESTKQGDSVYFNCSQVQGYKVEYLNESYFLKVTDYDYEEVDKLIEEVEEDKIYQDLMSLLGSDADMQNECEFLVSNETEFTIKNKIFDEEQNCFFIELELN